MIDPVPQDGDADSLRVVDVSVGRARTIDVTLLCPDTITPSIEAEDEQGNLLALDVLEQVRLAPDGLNLLATTDEGAAWRVAPGSSAIQILDSTPDRWTLRGEPTYALRSQLANELPDQPIAAELLSPLTLAPADVRPGRRYRFAALVGAHRCSVALVAEVEDADGRTLVREVVDPVQVKRGGETANLFSRLAVDVTIPPGGVRCRTLVVKGPTISAGNKTESVVFLARPELSHVSGVATSNALTVSHPLLEQVANGTHTLVRTVLRLQEALPATQAAMIRLIVRGDGTTHAIDRFVPLDDIRTKVPRLSIDRREVALIAQISPAPAGMVTFGVFVDGELSATVEAAGESGRFEMSATLADRHLDGRAHAIEVRMLPDHRVVAGIHAIVPSRVTSWEALQANARAPLDVASNPAAAFHFRNLRAWIDAERSGRVPTLPDLGRLHDELLGGFRKRLSYPPLTFPQHTNPDVSIVIPLHDKFEITYHGLCALLFAYNRTTFEVILVDDGSTDQTQRLEDVVSGVKVVRHAAAVGFVGSCNDGAAVAEGRFIAFLNNDTQVTVGWLDELVETFDNFDDVGLVGAKLVYGDGTLQEAGGIVWGSGNPWNVGRKGNAADPRFNYTRQVDYLSGAAILLPRSLWDQVGGFGPEFAPGYFEDTDLAMKVRDAGRRVVYVPTATVVHYEGQSAGTSTAAGMKRFQEVNRPTFKGKWTHLYAFHGKEGVDPDREKDRGISWRVLFIDQRFSFVDSDAGAYAAWQEIRLLQAMGAKVTFLPRNLAWMDRHTIALQRAGVECLYAPFVTNFTDYVERHARDYDMVYVNRFRIAELVVDTIRRTAPRTKIVFNLADLHFLRELREAAAGNPAYSFDDAKATREVELAMVRTCDLTLSYSDVERAVLTSHMDAPATIARVPWVVETDMPPRPPFAETRDLLFLGGFGHPPNIAAVTFFVREVMPALRTRLPGVRLRVVGSNATPEIMALASDDVLIEGQVADLDQAFATARLFVVPLLTGAGIKGKVLEAMARGMAMVLSEVAAEATGLSDGHDCLIATPPAEWVEAIARAYEDQRLWTSLGNNARALAAKRYSFEAGLATMRQSLARIDVFGGTGAYYRHARPTRYGFLP